MDTLDNIICISWFRGEIKSVMGPKCALQLNEVRKDPNIEVDNHTKHNPHM
jgi:hypothetical protein